MNNRVFLDSSFWITYRNDKEPRQAEANRSLKELFRQRTQFVTTLPVICEIHAAFSRTRRKAVVVLEDFRDNPLLTIEEVTHEDRESAIKLLHANRDKTYALCDAISFVVMRRLGIKRAAAFDRHFQQIGEFEIIC